EVIGALVGDQIEDLDDRAMIEVRGEPSLAAQPGAERAIVLEAGPDALDRDAAAQRRILGEKHLAHAAAAEPGQDSIATDVAGERSAVSRCTAGRRLGV